MRRHQHLAALGLLGAAFALLMTVLLPRTTWAAPEDRVQWGLHRIELERSMMVVHSEWSLDHTPAQPIPLANPLPAMTELRGAEPVLGDDGTIVALRFDPDGGPAGDLETRVPWGHVRRTETMPVPIPEGRSVHRVVLDSAVLFSPAPELGLVAQVGHYAPAEFDVVARHRFDARTDGDLRHVGAYYLRGRDLEKTGAFRGEVSLQRQRMGRAALVAGSVFGLLVFGMLLAHRRLSRRVTQERAEAFLEQEFRALDDEDFPPAAPADDAAATTMP